MTKAEYEAPSATPIDVVNAINLLRQAPALIAVLRGPDGVCTLMNDMFQKMWGSRSMVGKPMREAWPDLEGQGWFELAEQVYRTGTPVYQNEKSAVADWDDTGRKVEAFFNFVYAPLFAPSGEVEGIMIFGFEVTEQVKARKVLEESEQRLNNLANAMPQIVWIAGSDGAVTYYNSRVGEFSGAIKLPDGTWQWEGMVHPDDVERTALAWQSAVSTGSTYEQEHRIRLNDGTYRWLLSRAVPERDEQGKIIKWFGTATDIHAQKEAEETLKYSAIINENIADAIIATDENFNIVLWNKAAEKIYGWKKEEAIAKSVSAVLRTVYSSEEEKDRIIGLIRDSGQWHGNLTQHMKDGTPMAIEASVAVIKSKDNKITGYVAVNRNIEEQRRAQEAIRTTKEQLELTLRHFPSGIYLFDDKGEMLFINEKAAQINGLSFPEEATSKNDVQQIVESFTDHHIFYYEDNTLFDPKDNPTSYTLRTKKPISLTLRAVDQRTGSERWLLTSAAPLCDADGKLKLVLASVADITLQKNAEDLIKSSEARYRHIFEGTPVSIWEQDFSTIRSAVKQLQARGISNFQTYFNNNPDELHAIFESLSVIDLNNATLGLMEADSKEQIIANLGSIFIEETREALINEIIIIANGGGSLKYETVLRTIKGRRLEVLVHIDFPKTDDYSSVMVTLVDISTRKMAELALKQSEERFRLLSTTIPQAVWTMTPTGEIDYLSAQWTTITGQPISEAMTSWGKMIHPEDVEFVQQISSKGLETKTPWHAEFRLQHQQSKNYHWFLANTVPLKDEHGNVIKWIGSATNIQNLKEQSELLEEQVKKRTEELHFSNENLQQFAHVASHDLKEPLRKIKTFVDRLEREEGAALSDRARNYIYKINKSTDRMISMVEGVLSYSTVDSIGQASERVDLNGVIANVEAELELLIHEKGASIHYDELPVVEGAPILIFQLFYNILNNALKFGKPETPLIISIKAMKGVSDDQSSVTLCVQDNGIGFEQVYAEKIFDTFARLNPKDKYEGTGLGLSLCRKIVARHRGKIWAQGSKNNGAAFYIELPYKQHHKII